MEAMAAAVVSVRETHEALAEAEVRVAELRATFAAAVATAVSYGKSPEEVSAATGALGEPVPVKAIKAAAPRRGARRDDAGQDEPSGEPLRVVEPGQESAA
jgi:hypothetical protein